MKILFVIDKLNFGGVSSSLSNLLNEIHDTHECSLLVFSGDNKSDIVIPNNVEIIKPNKLLSILGKSQKEIMAESKILGIFRAMLVTLARTTSGLFARRILFGLIEEITGFDLAISYTHDVNWNSLTTGCNQFVAEKVSSKSKVAFVHCDYKNYGGYNPKQYAIYNRFDQIACVSKSCCEVFAECFPELEDRCICVANFINMKKVSDCTQTYQQYDHSKLNMVSVCRLTKEKGIIRVLEALRTLKDKGVSDINYVIVGDGDERASLELFCKEHSLTGLVNFIGESDNPFYYMKDADVFMLSSYHEAAPMVFGECKAIGLPIISTETISAKELVLQQQAGIVCSNTNEGILEVIEAEIKNRYARKSFLFDPNNTNIDAKRDLEKMMAIVEKKISKLD